MSWKRERDLLVAQTMAFVQSVTGKTADLGVRLETDLDSTLPDRPLLVERPALALDRPADPLPPVTRLTPIRHSDLRDEIRSRVAAFRAQQQAFDRDRDEYCNAMMAKARAASEQAVKASVRQPLKP